MTQDEHAARPAAFEGLLDVCKAQVTYIVTSTLSARPSQLNECYDACDPPAPLYSCAACGVRPIANPLSPRRRIALGDLVRVFEYEYVLAACSAKAAAERRKSRRHCDRAKRPLFPYHFYLRLGLALTIIIA